MGEFDNSPLQQVNQAPRGRDHYVAAVTNSPNLLMDITASVNRHHLEVAPHSQSVDLGLHLNSQLSPFKSTSLVGTTIKNFRRPPSLKASCFRNRSIIGREKAIVFPEPVRSLAMRSLPSKICSKVSYWTGKNLLIPLS